MGWLALVLVAGQAQASIIELSWVTQVSVVSGGGHPAKVGETLTTTILVDNGGSSIFGQTWYASHFVSYRQEEAPAGSSSPRSDFDLELKVTLAFITDKAGIVLTAGAWESGYDPSRNGAVTTSWAPLAFGEWWNNGFNETSCAFDADPFDEFDDACVYAVDGEREHLGLQLDSIACGVLGA